MIDPAKAASGPSETNFLSLSASLEESTFRGGSALERHLLSEKLSL